MIIIMNANDFEFYSANSAGGFQGNGYQCRNAGCVCDIRVMASSTNTRGPVCSARFVRIVTSTSWSLHDLIFVDCTLSYTYLNFPPLTFYHQLPSST